MQQVASSAMATPVSRRRPMPMVTKLAYRNLFHDRLSLIVTLVGIVFSVVLIAVQFGLYLGSEVRIAAMLDQAKGDLWVVPFGTKSFDLDYELRVEGELVAEAKSVQVAYDYGRREPVPVPAAWREKLTVIPA